jgi:bla regulator protein BlaR1
MTPWVAPVLMNHLWQSTLFVIAVWLATLALRRNAARVRCWLWTAASVKFLVPLSVLVGLGERFQWHAAAAVVQPTVLFVMEDVLAPVSVVAAAGPASIQQSPPVWPWLVLAIWCAGAAAVLLSWWRQWLPIRAALRRATPLRLDADYGAADLTVLSSPSMPAPGVVGMWRPRLLLPEGIVQRLTPAQLRALIAHERCHIHCHDNLAAALHMVVEVLFWFHPAVWWIERRLVEERERACDEEVLRAGTRPHDYAEGILEVCRRSVEFRLACVAGVSGSSLRARVEAILRNEFGHPMTRRRQWVLAAAVVAVLGGPIAGGALTAESQHVAPPSGLTLETASVIPGKAFTPGEAPAAQSRTTAGKTPTFEVASIKANTSRTGSRGVRFQPGGLAVTDLTVREIAAFAYGIPNPLRFTRIAGGPDWLDSERFDIRAKAEGTPSTDRIRLMLRALLADRFRLLIRNTTVNLPVYALTLARRDGRLGPRLNRTSDIDCDALFASSRGVPPALPRDSKDVPVCVIRAEPGLVVARSRTISDLVTVAFPRVIQDRVVVDRTGLKGRYDVSLEWTPDPRPFESANDLPAGLPVPPPPAALGPSIFTAIQEQLGLKLESQSRHVDVHMIDRVERPSRD